MEAFDHTTVVRTRFGEFENENKCKEATQVTEISW